MSFLKDVWKRTETMSLEASLKDKSTAKQWGTTWVEAASAAMWAYSLEREGFKTHE